MKLIILSLVMLLSGCAQLMSLTDTAAQKAGKAIQEYCTLPAESRQMFRDQVSKYAAPHSAAITCK